MTISLEQIRKITAKVAEERARDYADKCERMRPTINRKIEAAAGNGDSFADFDVIALGDEYGMNDPQATTDLIKAHYRELGFSVTHGSTARYVRISWETAKSS